MVKVRVLELRKTGPCTVRRNVKKANLKLYEKRRFRGVVVLVRPSTLAAIREGSKPPPGPRGDSRLPPPVPGIETEELTVREQYRGGGRKRKRSGKSGGRNSTASVNVTVEVTGTQAERDAAAARLEELMVRNLPFLKGAGVVGRRKTRKTRVSKLAVKSARFNGRDSGTAKRAILNEIREEVE